jgi:hypothetical protein
MEQPTLTLEEQASASLGGLMIIPRISYANR